MNHVCSASVSKLSKPYLQGFFFLFHLPNECHLKMQVKNSQVEKHSCYHPEIIYWKHDDATGIRDQESNRAKLAILSGRAGWHSVCYISQGGSQSWVFVNLCMCFPPSVLYMSSRSKRGMSQWKHPTVSTLSVCCTVY